MTLKRIAFPDSLDKRVIEAARELVIRNIAQPVLIANPWEVRDFCLKNQLSMAKLEVIDPKTSPLKVQFIQILKAKMPKASTEEIDARVNEPLWFASLLLDAGLVDFCIAGNQSSTADVLRAGIRVVGLEEGNKTVSSIMFMVPPNRSLKPNEGVLAFSDCGVVPVPTEEQLADIAEHTAKNFSRAMKEDARVALLSFSSHGSAKHENAEKVRRVTEVVKRRLPNFKVDGELQFDAAIVPSVATLKVPESPLEGQANVFIFPGLEAANIGYKIAQRLGNFAAVGPLIQGLRLPIHDLSRGCSSDEIVQVSELAISMAGL